MAMLKAPLVFVFNKAAIKAVMVVPMLAPKINGAALRKETIRCATIGTSTDRQLKPSSWQLPIRLRHCSSGY